jgi:hypothetical protein
VKTAIAEDGKLRRRPLFLVLEGVTRQGAEPLACREKHRGAV